jgi:predicted nuclease with TOPRIM domain
MAMEPTNLVIEHLRYIRGAVDGLRDDMREIKTRLGILESQYASVSNRIDRLDDRLERVERRLELNETAPIPG